MSRVIFVLVAQLALVACGPGGPSAPTPTAVPATQAAEPRPSVQPAVAATPAPTSTVPPKPAAARPLPTRPACAFVRGFEDLARQLGRELVGDCVEDERTNPATGNAEQRTTRGLFLWRRTDNQTQFTAGVATWYACPAGVVRRPSEEQFGCGTTAAAPAATAPPSAPAVAATSAVAPAPAPPAARPPVAPAGCPGSVPWNEARGQVGRQATIRGPVARANFASGTRGQPTFLDLGVGFPDPNRFTVVIWAGARRAFPTPPEQIYAGKTICVSGPVSLYQNVPQIEVSSPAAIVVDGS